MSVCLDPNNLLTTTVSTSSTTAAESVNSSVAVSQTCADVSHPETTNQSVVKSTAKLVVANQPIVSNGNPVLQKIPNPPLITVLNSAGPLTVVKTLCVTSTITSSPQFTVVNSNLNVTSTGKSPTITLLNGPLTVVKAIPAPLHCNAEKNTSEVQCSSSSPMSHNPVPAIIENRTHNVFVKNTCSEAEIPQSHKLLTANNFPQSNLINISQQPNKINGQRNKLKILSNIMTNPPQGTNNMILNKPPVNQRYVSRPKIVGPNGATNTKYMNKPVGNLPKPPHLVKADKSPQRTVYPTHKSQLKTIPPMNNYIHKPQGIKTLSPQLKPLPGQIQRTGSGLRTIPAQKPPKVINKPNYIGKHAVQAQKIKHPHTKMKNIKMAPNVSSYNTYNQALTAEILETLGNKNGSTSTSCYSYKNFEILPNRYDNPYTYDKTPMVPEIPMKPVEEKSKSGLDALSLICQAVLLDHNYNATLPPESPTRSVPQQLPQMNGVTTGNLYSPGIKRRSLSSSNTVSATSSMSNMSVLPSNSTSVATQEDDAASDISYGSDRKHDTEGEETDTAPEAEAVNNNEDAFDQFGDYVTRCICGFLHDDGYMIECDRCKVWQHVQCVIKNKLVPDEYLCEVCDPTKHIDRQKAKMVQQQWLRDRQFPDMRKNKETKLKEALKHRDALTDSDSSGDEQTEISESLSKNEMTSLPKAYCCVPECNSVKSKTVSLFQFPPSKTLRQKWAKAIKIGKKVGKHMLVCSLHFREMDFHPNTPFRLRKRLKANVVPSLNLPPRKHAVTEKSCDRGGPPSNSNVTKGRTTLLNRRKSDAQQKQMQKQRRESSKEPNVRKQVKRRERKIIKRKPKCQQKTHSDDENQDVFTTTQLPQLRQWIENYEEAVTNHYSPELRARISSIRVNGAHSDLPLQFDPSVQKCRVQTHPLTEIKYLVSTIHLPPNTSVVELRGKYMLSTQHRNGGGALTTRQHAQRPGPFLFFYRLHKDNTEVCVDTRTYGNSARFIRRSCKPNAELRHCIEKGVLHLYIVTMMSVEKNTELTIKHESHDLAAIGTTHIACACGNLNECTVNRTSIKKNGESTDMHRKRRGRRTTSIPTPIIPEVQEVASKVKEENVPSPIPSPSPPPPPVVVSPAPVSVPVPVVKEEPVEHKPKVELPQQVEPKLEAEVSKEPKVEIKQETQEDVKDIVDVKQEAVHTEEEEKEQVKEQVKEEPELQEQIKEEVKPSQPPISTRRSSHHKADLDEHKEHLELKEDKCKNKKLSREERKLEAILRAIEQMEKADQRKQEHQAKQAHRRESEPGPSTKDDEKTEPKVKRRRRKGRTRTTSTSAQSSRRNRINSTDSYLTSGDESLLSPSDNHHSHLKDSDKDRDAISKGEKSPIRDDSNNSNSAHSSPETHVSSACLLVQAAVEPLEPGFKFPKTKKVLMNEWLNKTPEPIHSASSISPSSLTPHITTTEYDSTSNFYSGNKSLNSLVQTASYCDSNNVQPRGNAKKRWLRQAISEDQCDSPSSRPESPPVSEMVAPPKKRRLPRESLSNEDTSVPTPTGNLPAAGNKIECETSGGCVEIVYNGADGDSPTQTLESDAVLKERAAEMKQEFSSCLPPSTQDISPCRQLSPLTCLLDPRLSREHNHQMFSNSEHLVGTVEKTLSILGFEDRKPEPITPAKRKLSITEYRQRKKLNNNECSEKTIEESNHEENNSMESFKPIRPRSNSSSSSTSLTSSDDEPLADIPGKASAFNSEPTELERQREISRFRLKKAFGLSLDNEPFKSTLDVKAILNCELPPVVKPSIPLSSPTFPIPGSLIPGTINSSSPKSLFSENSSSSHASPVKSQGPSEQQPDKPAGTQKVDECEETALKPPTSPISDGEMSPMETSYDEQDDVPPVSPMLVAESEIVSLPKTFVRVVEDKKLASSKLDISPVTVVPASIDNKDEVEPNLFYTPDEEENTTEVTEVERMSYVPPFNNPVYPNTGFSAYTSVIDNDARYESRNPSPPPELEPVVDSEKQQT